MFVLFINCSLFPFIAWILSGLKTYETRNRNTLKSLIGKTVFLAETGKHKKPVVYAIATITSVLCVTSLKEYNLYRKKCMIKKGSIFDFIPGKKKYLYALSDIKKVVPFVPAEGTRHGRICMDFVGIDKYV